MHLSPSDYNFRLKEANIISEKVKHCRNDKHIILGDFNAHSPFDEETLKHNNSLLKQYLKSENETYSNLRLKTFDYSVISTFLALPTIDVSKNFIDIKNRYTFPTPALIGLYRENMNHVIQTQERIDYILTSPTLSKSCTNVSIFNNEETATLSDHYPVMAEFNFKTEK